MLEVGKSYSSSDIAELVFNVSSKTFSNRRQAYLDKLSQYYE